MKNNNFKTLDLPPNYNYIGAFLTFKCNLSCTYCINNFNTNKKYNQNLTSEEWIKGLNRINKRHNLPVTLQGGEPSLHPGFNKIINSLNHDVDILTNVQFDPTDFVKRTSTDNFNISRPYAPIRVSYHPSTMDLNDAIHKVNILNNHGYRTGIWCIEHPENANAIQIARRECQRHSIDFRTKDFLGIYQGKLYGNYKYPDALLKNYTKCMCRTSELLIAPDGHIYKCHSDLYQSLHPIGHLLDPQLSINNEFKECSRFGDCNPCDIKVKFDRFQNHGHCSVEIRHLD